jgi:hypothetical protein
MNKQSGDNYLLFPEIKDREKAGRLIDATMVRVMKQAKTPPELIYAYLKCGFIVTKWNKGKFTRKELQEWSEAVDEYRSGKRSHPLLKDRSQ